MREKFESGHHNALLHPGVVRCSERISQRAIYGEGARRVDSLAHLTK
jgi:hypothetical protein